jgi:hypothetical protein
LNRFPHFTTSYFFPCGGEADIHKLSHGSPHQAVAQG